MSNYERCSLCLKMSRGGRECCRQSQQEKRTPLYGQIALQGPAEAHWQSRSLQFKEAVTFPAAGGGGHSPRIAHLIFGAPSAWDQNSITRHVYRRTAKGRKESTRWPVHFTVTETLFAELENGVVCNDYTLYLYDNHGQCHVREFPFGDRDVYKEYFFIVEDDAAYPTPLTDAEIDELKRNPPPPKKAPAPAAAGAGGGASRSEDSSPDPHTPHTMDPTAALRSFGSACMRLPAPAPVIPEEERQAFLEYKRQRQQEEQLAKEYLEMRAWRRSQQAERDRIIAEERRMEQEEAAKAAAAAAEAARQAEDERLLRAHALRLEEKAQKEAQYQRYMEMVAAEEVARKAAIRDAALQAFIASTGGIFTAEEVPAIIAFLQEHANAEQTEAAILAIDRYATSKKCSVEAAIMILKRVRGRAPM